MHSSPDTTAPQPRRKRIRLSVKILGFFVTAMFLTVAMVMYIGSTSTYESSKKRLGAEAELLTGIKAAEAGGAVRFGKIGDLEPEFERLITDSGGEISQILILDSAGEVLLAMPQGVPVAAETRGLARAALESGALETSADGLAVAAPVLFGKDRVLVGAIAMDWTDAVMAGELRSTAWWQILASGLVTMTAALIAAFFLRAVLFRPIGRMTGAVERLVAGEDVEMPGTDRGDEIGTLARSLTVIYHSAVAAKRIRAAVDSSRSALMITDADLTITYVNPVLQEVLAGSRDYWRKFDAKLDIENLVGQSIDRFHKNPAHQRNLLQSLQGAYKGMISFGERSFLLTIAAVSGPQGERIGYVTQWEERTVALSIESQIADIIDAVADGDFSKRLSIKSDQKFINDVAAGMNRLCEIVDRFLAALEQTPTAMADGDLTRRIEVDYSGRLGEVSGAVNNTIGSLGRLVADIKATVGAIGASTGEIANGARQLSSRTESQASSLEETAATMEEMAATVKSNAESANTANALVSDTTKRAERGQNVVLETVTAMNRIKESAGKISEIISVIDGIAFQTNLLALNAAVEAARAGDAGKGFAVVASEVRTLAQRSSQAAKDITTLIGDSTSHVNDGARLTEAAGDALNEIVEGITTVAKTIDDITAASREQSVGVDEISQTVSHLDSMTQENASLADQSSATAQTLASEAQRLAGIVRVFRIDGAEEAPPERRREASPGNRPGASGAQAAALAKPAKPNGAGRKPAAAAGLRPAVGSDWSEF